MVTNEVTMMLIVTHLRWVVVLGLALLFLMASPVLAANHTPESSMTSMASVSVPIPASACPRLHTINPNETRLVQITDWYGLDLATVAALNGMEADAPLTTGNMLCLAAPTPKPAIRSVPVYGCSQLHTINPNEKQLVQITDWYGLDLATVAALNGMEADAPLTTGDMVCLAGPATRAPAPRPIPANACPKLHTVNPNETRLVQITDWYGLDLTTVAALNGMEADAPLMTGSMLCLSTSVPPPPAPMPTPIPANACPRLHTINPNETRLVQITDWYGLDLVAVAALNGMDAAAPLTTGSMICLSATASTPVVPDPAPEETGGMPPAATPDMKDEEAEAPASTAVPQGTASDSALDRLTQLRDGSMTPEDMAKTSRTRYCNAIELQTAKENCWWRLENNQELGFPKDLGLPNDDNLITFYGRELSDRLWLTQGYAFHDLSFLMAPVLDGVQPHLIGEVIFWGYNPMVTNEWPISAPLNDLAIVSQVWTVDGRSVPTALHVCVNVDRTDPAPFWICILDGIV